MWWVVENFNYRIFFFLDKGAVRGFLFERRPMPEITMP
jgi:hypothetical protein